MTMKKTGLLLLQSVASSALRSGRGPAPSRASMAGGRRWSAARGARPAAAAALLVAAAGSPSLAACNGANGDGESDGVNGATAATMTATPARRSIDEPDETPTRDPRMPFPEAALWHDTYDGVTLNLAEVPAQRSSTAEDADAFGDALSRALDVWTSERRRGIWLRVPTSRSHLVAPATALGFDFRHAEPGFCVLTKWLPPDAESRLPHGPTHQVGIGALVLHPKTGKMLAVQEKTGPAAKRKLWKMPTGLLDPGEDVADAAVRELREETGLDCTFDRIVCFRQAHGGLFGRSDMFFVCLCRLAPKYLDQIEEGGEVELLPQEEEILMADWIDLDYYAEQGVWKESPLYKELNGAMIRAARSGFANVSSGDATEDCTNGNHCESESHGFVAKNLPVGFRPGRNTIYVSSKL